MVRVCEEEEEEEEEWTIGGRDDWAENAAEREGVDWRFGDLNLLELARESF